MHYAGKSFGGGMAPSSGLIAALAMMQACSSLTLCAPRFTKGFRVQGSGFRVQALGFRL